MITLIYPKAARICGLFFWLAENEVRHDGKGREHEKRSQANAPGVHQVTKPITSGPISPGAVGWKCQVTFPGRAFRQKYLCAPDFFDARVAPTGCAIEVVANRVLLVIILMVVFSGIEGVCLRNLCIDGGEFSTFL